MNSESYCETLSEVDYFSLSHQLIRSAQQLRRTRRCASADLSHSGEIRIVLHQKPYATRLLRDTLTQGGSAENSAMDTFLLGNFRQPSRD